MHAKETSLASKTFFTYSMRTSDDQQKLEQCVSYFQSRFRYVRALVFFLDRITATFSQKDKRKYCLKNPHFTRLFLEYEAEAEAIKSPDHNKLAIH